MSYNGIGLQTPRGSGTNGYVQRSLANIRKKPQTPYSRDNDYDKPQTKARKPNPDIMEHDRKREIEVQCFELQDKLEEEGLDEDEIEKKVVKLRDELTKQAPSSQNVKSLKPHQIHDLAAAKEKEMEKVRKAFGIREDYVEGDAFKRMKERTAE